MKKTFLKFIPLFLGIAMAFSACSSDEDADDLNDNPTVPKPTASVAVNGDLNQTTYEVTQGSPVQISITVLPAIGGGKDLSTVSLSQNGVNTTNGIMMNSSNSNVYDFSTTAEQNIKNADDEKLILSGTFANITGTVGTTTYQFVIKDKDGLLVTKTFDIVVTTSTPFTKTKTGEVWHILGSKRGSWSLTADTSISASAAPQDADIVNVDDATTGFTGSFKVGASRANTNFVKAGASFDYATATQEEALVAFGTGNQISQTTSAPMVGDVYIYNLGNGSLSIVKITAIDAAASCGTACKNPGKMTFEYKK